MILVGPSLGAAVAIDFAIYHPEAVSSTDNRHEQVNNICFDL